jgi:hypothetical protein
MNLTSRNKNKLYLICPDCNTEYAIKDQFKSNIFLLTALGVVFDFSSMEASYNLDDFINRETITEIVIVNDSNCTFIESTIHNRIKYNTVAEKELEKLQINNLEKFESLNIQEQQVLLAKLNTYRQAFDLLEVPFIGPKIDDKQVAISGLIYDRDNNKFEPLQLGI